MNTTYASTAPPPNLAIRELQHQYLMLLLEEERNELAYNNIQNPFSPEAVRIVNALTANARKKVGYIRHTAKASGCSTTVNRIS